MVTNYIRYRCRYVCVCVCAYKYIMYNGLVNRDIICPARTRCYAPTAVVAQLIALFASVSRLLISQRIPSERSATALSSWGRGRAMCVSIQGRFIAFDFANKSFTQMYEWSMIIILSAVFNQKKKNNNNIWVSNLDSNVWKLKNPHHKYNNGKLLDLPLLQTNFNGISI